MLKNYAKKQCFKVYLFVLLNKCKINIFDNVIHKHPFIIDAVVILPDHLHCIWTLPENDQDFSTRWRLIKSYFSRKCETISPENISLLEKRKNNGLYGNIVFGNI